MRVTTRVELIEHTADVGIRVLASTPAEAFMAAAHGMLDIMVPNRPRVEASERSEVRLQAEGWADLLVTWLEELLFTLEIESLVPVGFEFDRMVANGMEARVSWRRINPESDRGVQIKAVTYHMLVAEPTENGFEAQVIFDI
jgi:SHS2 domain-containing protein